MNADCAPCGSSCATNSGGSGAGGAAKLEPLLFHRGFGRRRGTVAVWISRRTRQRHPSRSDLRHPVASGFRTELCDWMRSAAQRHHARIRRLLPPHASAPLRHRRGAGFQTFLRGRARLRHRAIRFMKMFGHNFSPSPRLPSRSPAPLSLPFSCAHSLARTIGKEMSGLFSPFGRAVPGRSLRSRVELLTHVLFATTLTCHLCPPSYL